MSDAITIFMCGDVMTGRGIDQILPHPVDPKIYESFMKSSLEYVRLAEEVNGPIRRPVEFSYIWGDALEEFKQIKPDVKIINLETAVTKSNEYIDKGINYRMHPEDISCITSAGIDCCSLANNHVLDWGYQGLVETIETLEKAGLKHVGAGRDIDEAESPAILKVVSKGRVIVFGLCDMSSGVPQDWSATSRRPGVNLLSDLEEKSAFHIKDLVGKAKQKGDVVIISIHWGGNWGYDVPVVQTKFAHLLIDKAEVDIVHGHSSHHIKGVEVYNERLILYGCGDFINDYEGIGGYEHFRGDLSLMYFAGIDPDTGKLSSLSMTPAQMKRFRVNRASGSDAKFLAEILNREGKRFGTGAYVEKGNTIKLRWK